MKKIFLIPLVSLFLFACEKKDDHVILYTSQPIKDVTVLIDAFQKQNPGIKVEVFRSGTVEVLDKISKEAEKNQIQADVVMISDSISMESLKRKGLLESLEGIEIAGISKAFRDPDHTYCGTKKISIGLVYNKNLESKITSFADLNKPEFKGQIIMPSPLYSGAAALMLGIVIEDPKLGWDFYKKLKLNDVQVVDGNGDVIEAIARGEKLVGIVVDFMALGAKNKGSPIDFVYPAEGVITLTEPIALIKKNNPEKTAKAKKFIQFVLSLEGQEIAKNQGYMCITERHPIDTLSIGVNTEKVLKNFEENKERFSGLFTP